jgi:hypothetical protein
MQVLDKQLMGRQHESDALKFNKIEDRDSVALI